MPMPRYGFARRALVAGLTSTLLALCGCAPSAARPAVADPGGAGGGTSVKDGRGRGGTRVVAIPELDEPSEAELGRAVALRLTNRFQVEPDAKLTKYVNLVGQTVVSVSGLADRHFVFGVLAEQTPNTYSAPGFVFITRGALARMQDEAELAGVLGHEIAHLQARDALTIAGRSGVLERLAGGAVDRGTAFDEVVDGYTDVVTRAGYDAAMEAAAEQQVIAYLHAARYDAKSYVRFLRRMQSAGAVGAMPTHADLAGRTARADKDAAHAAGTATLAERFRRFVPPTRSTGAASTTRPRAAKTPATTRSTAGQ